MRTKSWITLGGLVGFVGAAHCALIDRGGGLIYDSHFDITWLADMNYAETSGYAAANAGGVASNRINSDGRMGWDAANDWASGLVYAGYDDWRLPTLNASDATCESLFSPGGFPQQSYGYNCTLGELSHLFAVDLGTKKQESVINPNGDTATQIANLALFVNVKSTEYWSGTEFIPDSADAWHYGSIDGSQNWNVKGFNFYALAVRPGDVSSTIPEPQTLLLALIALGLAASSVRMRMRVN